MFTGLVESVGKFEGLVRSSGGWRLKICEAQWSTPLVLGESVAVQGACLTVVEISANGFVADLLDETLSHTALSTLKPGARLNLERALKLGDRLGGHFVSGHVDEAGRIKEIAARGRDIGITVECSPYLARFSILKGSIALDGVSLTITALSASSITVDIIPHTLKASSLCERREGDSVNLEADLLGKHIARLLGNGGRDGLAGSSPLQIENLLKAGFI